MNATLIVFDWTDAAYADYIHMARCLPTEPLLFTQFLTVATQLVDASGAIRHLYDIYWLSDFLEIRLKMEIEHLQAGWSYDRVAIIVIPYLLKHIQIVQLKTWQSRL